MSRPVSYRKRSRKALGLANRMIWRYARLHISKKIFGKRYHDRRLPRVEYKNAKDLSDNIVELKGLFIKFGQLLSIMSNVMPKAYGDLLESLQDHAPESPVDSTKQIIMSDLGKSVDELFSDFPETPIASASIGQVYAATLKTGQKVAVKVQHKNIEELAKADLKIIERMMNRIGYFVKINGLDFVYEQIAKMIIDELDFEKERASMKIIGSNLTDNQTIRVPDVYEEMCSKRILTTSFEEGVKITQVDQIKEWGVSTEHLAKELILAFCQMVLSDGVYHADPHPGNILVNEKGKIILLDFGATAILTEKTRKEIPRLLQAALSQNYDGVLNSLQKMGFIGDQTDSRKVAKKIVDAFGKFLSSEVDVEKFKINDVRIEDIKGSSIEGLLKELSIKELTKTVQVPKDWVLLNRTLVLVGGISNEIAPNLDPVEVVKPYVRKQIISFENIKEILTDGIKNQIRSIIALPTQLNTFLSKANNGELEFEVNNDSKKIYALGQQFLYLTLSLAFIHFYQKNEEIIYLTGLVFAAIMFFRSIWKNRK